MVSSDPTYPLFPVFAFLSFVIVLIPLPWHLQAWNSGTCLFMVWTAIACLNQFVNSIVWKGNVTDWAPLWCDISSRLMVGISVAIPAASLCISRRLCKIATCQTPSSYAHNKRAILVDLAIGLGIPVLQMVLQFIVQGHRYDIFEDFGCYPTTVNTFAAYPLSFIWPNVICLISGIYCILTLRAFIVRRAQFSQLISSNTSLTMNRYFRLMSLAMVSIFTTIPLSTYGLYINISSRPYYPWKSWSDTHSGWYIIDTYPAILLRSRAASIVTLELSRWSLVLSAFVFFGFFGLAEEARKQYKLLFSAASKRFGFDWSITRETRKMSNSDTLPMFSHRKLDSGAIYSTRTTKTSSLASSSSHATCEMSNFIPTLSYKGPKAVGSFSDLSYMATPSTAVPPYSDVRISKALPPIPSSLIDLPVSSYPRQSGRTFKHDNAAVSPRPLTYPSTHPSHLGVAFAFPKNV